MQELNLISTNEFSSENLKNDLRGVAFDPLKETLYTLVSGNKPGEEKQLNQIISYPTQQSKEAKELLQIESSKSLSQFHHPIPLASKQVQRVEHEASVRQEEQRILKQQVIAENKKGKKIYQADTYCEPDCLRFCPANSSNQIEISLSGLTAKAKGPVQTARTNKGFSEGVHYWEFICPISCTTLSIGVSNKYQTNNNAIQQFRTTTPRVIGLELNLEKLTLNYWLNGRYLKERQKKIPENEEWYPTIKFNEAEYSVIINPFCQGKGTIQDELNQNFLPKTLKCTEETWLSNFLLQFFSRYLYVIGLPYQPQEQEMLQTLKINFQENKEQAKKVVIGESLSQNTVEALIEFENKFATMNYLKNHAELKLLNNSALSDLILYKSSNKDSGKNLKDIQNLETHQKQLVNLLKNKVLSRSEFEIFMTICHLKEEASAEEQILIKLIQLQQIELGQEPQNQDQKFSHNPTTINYLDNSDKILLTNGSQLKLVHRERDSFNIQHHSSFQNQLKGCLDMVKLRISHQNLKFLAQNLSWRLINEVQFSTILSFLDAAAKAISQCQDYIELSYALALQVVQILLNVAVIQYETLEEFFDNIEQIELIPSTKPIKVQLNPVNKLNLEVKNISLIDAHSLLNIILTLEDQLWTLIQDDETLTEVKKLQLSKTSRLHTAYGRLSSLITFPQSLDKIQSKFDPLYLSDLGLYNSEDQNFKLKMFQDFSVELENIFESSSKIDLQASLERQLPNNLMLKGFPSWNVPLAQTLNNFPPAVHTNAVSTRDMLKEEKIDNLKTINGSDLIMTTGKDGSLNIWDSRLRLHKVAQINIKDKQYLTENISAKKIQHLLKQNQLLQEYEDQKYAQEQIQASSVRIIMKKQNEKQQEGQKPKPQQQQQLKLEEVSEDLLFTMFNEQQDDSAQKDNLEELSIRDSEEDEQELNQYLEEVMEATAKVELSKEDKNEEQKKEKEKEKAKEEKPKEEEIIPKEDFLAQLLMMGFSIEVAKQALIKVKNVGLDQAVDAVMEIQATLDKEKPKVAQQQKAKKAVIQSWSCGTCTFINSEGKSVCDMCTQPAPSTAYIYVKTEEEIQKEKEEEDKKKRLEEEKRQKEEQEKKQKIEAEIQKKQEEERRVQKSKELIEKYQNYYKKIKILDYAFGTYKQGRDSKPLFIAAVTENGVNQKIDIQLYRAGYKIQDYLKIFIGSILTPKCTVCDIPFKSQSACLEHVMNLHQTLVQSYYPIFIQSQLTNSKWNILGNKHSFKTMKIEEQGFISWPFQKLDAFIQVGTDISEDKPMFLIGVGSTKSGEQRVIIQKVLYCQGSSDQPDIKVETLSEDSNIFKEIGLNTNIQKIWINQNEAKQEGEEILLVQLQNGKFESVQIQRTNQDFSLHYISEVKINHYEEQILDFKNGILYIKTSKNEVRRVIVGRQNIERQNKLRSQEQEQSEQMSTKEAVTEEQVLQMEIDPSMVKIADIQKYEKLMYGKAIPAQSNSSLYYNSVNNTNHKGSLYYSKHHWINNNDEDKLGPLEIKFAYPTSLISLNIDLYFDSTNTKTLVEQLEGSHHEKTTDIDNQQEKKEQSEDQQISNLSDNNESSQFINKLGLLSIQQLSEEIIPETQQDKKDKKEAKDQKLANSNLSFLPLEVYYHKGAAYSQNYSVAKVVVDNNMMFASNYPRPEFYFKHQHNQVMLIDKVTIRSQLTSKCGAQPIGAGLVFLSENIEAFQQSSPFFKFTKSDYTEWKQNRLKNPSPLMPYEPAAYFEFEGQDLTLTVDIDFKRLAKYIYLKPTAFRKASQPGANQNFNNVPLEIEFFGVSGSVVDEYSSSAQSLNESNACLSIRGLQSNYNIAIKELETQDGGILKEIEGIEVLEIKGSHINLSSQTVKQMSIFNNDAKLMGKSSLKITDSSLQLQLLKGLSIDIFNKISVQSKKNWVLKGVTVQAIVQDDSNQSSQVNSQPLFNNSQIPLSYLRSCLLSPKYFSVINKVLTQILSQPNNSDNQLRQHILKFLNKIMKLNRDFIPLIMQEIQIEHFLNNNLFINDPSGFAQVFEFLQNFQRDAKFCNELYSILINGIQQIPDSGISQQGYDAFLGMLKWATPINPEKTLEVLLQSLFSNICLSKLPPIQTKEYIHFRTRTSLINSYPFDNFVFRAPNQLQQSLSSSSSSAQQNSISKTAKHENISEYFAFQNKFLPLKEMTRIKEDFVHQYSVQFDLLMQITDIKIHLGQLDNSQYKMNIKIFSDNQLLYYHTLDENTFAHYAQMIYAKQVANPLSDSSNDALHLSHLDIQADSLKIYIEFGISNSTLPKVNSKVKPPETIIEFYGNPVDPNISQLTLKEMLDKKAQEFWISNAKIFKVGRSMQYLQIIKDSIESKLVPQGQQVQQQPPQAAMIQEQKQPNKDELVEQINTSNSLQQQQQQQSKNQELELLQDELKGKIRANDPNINEIVEKIQTVQLSLFNINNSSINSNRKSLIDSLEFYLTLVSDYTKLVRRIVKTQIIQIEKLNKILRQIMAQNGMEDFTMICFELFKRFIAYEQGSIRQEVLIFIDELIYPIMTYEEKKLFSFNVIEEFLSQPISFISQKQVLEALNTLGIPEGELISFMLNKLNISNQGGISIQSSQLNVNPFIFMSSIFILSLNQLKKIQIPEPGKAMHLGISCSGCQAKMIIGWRYKCGSCTGDYNFDSDCADKHIVNNPEHVLLVIQEPLPYDSKIKPPKLVKPILPKFEFKQSQEGSSQIIHEFFNCENCGKKPIVGNCFRCVNCEDYSLCEDCYKQNLYDHFSYHIFYKLHKPLKESEKNPTSLLQVLDPSLYSSNYSVQLDKKKQNLYEDENDLEDFEDLAPLSMSRSLSVPMNAQQKVKQVKGGVSVLQKLSIEQQFIILFNTCVWICSDSLKAFSRQEKVILLKLTIETMLQLIKLTGVEKIYEVVSNKENFFNLLVSILQLNNKELISLYKNLLDQMRQPPSLSRSLKEINTEKDKQKKAAKISDKKQMLSNQLKIVKQLLESMLVNIQSFLKWVVDIGINQELAKLQIPKGQEPLLLFNSYTQSQQIWLDHLSFLVEMFIKTNDELKDQQNKQGSILEGIAGKHGALEKIPEEEGDGLEKEEDLLPLSMARSVSVPLSKDKQGVQQQASNVSLQLIKSLIQLLHINDSNSLSSSSTILNSFQSPSKQGNPAKSSNIVAAAPSSATTFKQQESCTKYLSLMWSLALKSLTTVSINQLIEAKIFDSLVSAFLISTEEIQQITFPQILNISESIAKNSTHANDISKFISNLLFTTLENVTNTHHEKVGYSICQGWIDILVSSTINRNAETEKKNAVFAKMNAEEMSSFLKRTSNYLISHLNRGSFEGITGCTPEVVLRLNLAQELIAIVRYTESKTKVGALAIQELFQQCSSQNKLKKELQESMDYLITWLFLNARMPCDEQAMTQLGNSCNMTPATTSIKKMTELIEEILLLVSNTEMNETAIKIALSTLTTVVRKMNKSIWELAQSHSMGFDTSIKLSNRSNEYFIKFLKQWLISDTVASYFVFDLQGFEFLLDTIGLGSESKNEQLDFEIIEKEGEQKEQQMQQLEQKSDPSSLSKITLQGSDMYSYLENIISEGQVQNNQPKKEEKKEAVAAGAGQIISNFEQSNPPQVQEFSKSLCMVSNNGNDPINQYQKTDWAVNKRAYKHRIIIKYLTGSLKNEYWMLFSLPHPVELKEIQIGFNNYWGADTEVYVDPLSVLVEAGMDENNLSLVCNLQIVKDDAFGSVSATVFGKNLQSFPLQTQNESNSSSVMQQVEEIIQQKMSSLQNFKVQYIKFCMRRFALTCLENSPLSIKFTKQVAFGINYISLLGFNMNMIGDYLSYIKSEQKKTALEILSIICSGDFASILKVIANQSQTIEKMKKSFNQLASLVTIKKNLIEPTFIAISAHNNEMGDWIINQFLNNSSINQHASLVGEIVRCNKEELSRRLMILQEHVMKELTFIYRSERSTHGTLIKKLLPLIQIYIQTLRISAPELGHHKIDLNVNEEEMIQIVSLLSTATQERESQTKVLTQLLVLLLCPPHPFVNKQVDVYDFTLKHLLLSNEVGGNSGGNQQAELNNSEQQTQKEFLASIFSATHQRLAKEILRREDKLDQIINFGKVPIQKNSLQNSLRFWFNVSQDVKVKEELIARKLPIQLYTNLRDENPNQNNKIIKFDSSIIEDQELNLIIELIKHIISGSKSLENELAELLKSDLDHLSKIRDMNFVNKVFLSLLKEEQTVPVCIWPYDSDSKRWIPHYKPLIIKDTSAAQTQSSNNNFLPSTLLQGESRSILIKNFKDIVGTHAKGTLKKLTSSNWTLAHQQTEPGTVAQFAGVWKNIENKAPVFILVSATTNGTAQNAVFGCFCAKGIPQVPANLAQDSDYTVATSPEDFLFCYVDDSSFHHFKPKTGVNILSMFTDYEGGGAISIANDFILVSYSYDFVFTVGVQYEIEKIQEKLNAVPKKQVPTENQVFNKLEIWTLGAVPSQQQVAQAKKVKFADQVPSSQSDQEGFLADFKHPWFVENSPFKNYRTNPVFMVPSHLSLTDLGKILLQSNVTFKPRFNPQLTSQKETLTDLYNKFRQEEPLVEVFNSIIDLEYETNQLINMEHEEKAKDKEEQDQSGENAGQMSGYIPKMGLFQSFEAQDGVKKIISVTLSSLSMWKQDQQAKSWSLWLKELESFSQLPLFFQIFLKNTKCKDLLFKVLAGQPDSEISAEVGKTEVKTKWEEEQKNAVQFNYKILSEVFQISNDIKLRNVALSCGLLPRILERLGSISGEKARTYDETEDVVAKEQIQKSSANPLKEVKNTEKKFRKGVGYSKNVGEIFNVAVYLENKKLRNDQIKNLIDICSNFLTSKEWKANEEVLEVILESPLLPLLEASFRNGSWLEMAKESEVYHSYLQLTRAIVSQKKLVPCLIEIDKRYKPAQSEPIYKLLGKLHDLAEIFINCLSQQEKSEQDSEIPERLAKDVIKTYRVVMNAVDKLKRTQDDENFFENALSMPVEQSYRLLLQDLRFAYMDMKDPNDQTGQHFKHHYQSIAAQNQNPPSAKMVRLAQELADLSNALPSDHTNAIYVRVDQSRVDMMKALICGASNTPYAHGCYEFDIFCDNNYPREPCKMNLITTGSGQVRFNPNLYACGKVCLSLLGTWRGQATENWDPKLSTILQVLLSTQAIIMSEEVYFNEPGFENEAGTPEGEKKNEGYQNIVRYCNVKFAMIDQIKKPSRGFETVIKRHFYLKKAEILQEVNHWVTLAEKNEAAYAGLVNDHNYNWANQFKASKTKYKEMLQQAVKQLEEELNLLEKPNVQDLKMQQKQKKRVLSKKVKNQDIKQGGADLEEISVGTDDEEEQINTESKEMDIKDEKVQDRWSRYIGAMGAEAVAKQAAANIFLSGAGALGIEIAKNIVLAGCRHFTLHDYKPLTYRDLSGQFFLSLEEDILNPQKKKATRGEACLPRLRQLNYYVKCTLANPVPLPLNEEELLNQPWNFKQQDVIILTEATNEEIIFVNNFCRKHGKKFICTDAYGPFGRIFNDFGEKFEVLDKNGEELQDVMIKSITNEEKGIVELLPSNKHKFEDGDEVLFTKVEGMQLLPGKSHEDESVQSNSINDTIHKVQVITPYSFKIGDTTRYDKYLINGIAKQLKTKKIMSFKTYEETMLKGSAELPLDGNLSIADFEKMSNNSLSHIAYEALDVFRKTENRYPGVWNLEDAKKFVEVCKGICKRYDINPEELTNESYEIKFFHLFSFSCQGVLNPLCAYLGGFVAQECIKAITQKFSPIGQVFYYDAFEILPDFDLKVHIQGENNNEEGFFESKYVKEIVKTREQTNRYDGLRIIVGQDIVEQLNYTKLFMVGAGAIGCELLKNYAMIGVGVGKVNQQLKKKSPGQIVLTDPDVIEVSNLNRQFLFREKHLRKPKSQTAATAAIYMNQELKENIVARLDKVHEGTSNIFTDQFFESLTVVTNALDNVHARRYIDARCVTAKTPLLESGTLGPKGHVQVVLPYKTESYGSMNDPEDNNEIPHCTLKMFPEETLHCVEWARDKFGKLFTQGPKNTLKILEEGSSFQPTSQQDIQSLRECVKILQKKPKTFDQCVEQARVKFEKYFNHDIRQLLHVYPLDAKTKEGNPFWALPKRPPTHIQFDKDNILHCYFVTSYACLRATIFKIAIPSEKPRSEDFRRQVGILASKIQVPDFVPNDEKAKEIQASVNKAATAKDEEKKEEEKKEEEDQKIDPNDTEKLINTLKSLMKEIQASGIKNYSKQFIGAEEFEKDNDANFHIDLIYSMANCRSSNYKLDPMEWITVKLKAGRIVPALATTTASIAGLQTLELIKLIKQCKKTDHRNIFLNLAVPMMQASEPGDVLKTKLCEGLEVTLWDRWEIKLGKDVKLFQIMGYIEQQHNGLQVRDVLRGNTPIYFHAIMSAQGKEKERDKLLNSKVVDLVGADSDEKYVDLNLTCIRKDDQEEKILSGVPPVRVYFE